MQGLNASGQMITTQQLTHSLLVGWGRGRRVEVRTLVGWDKDSMQTEQNNEFFNYFTSAGRYLATSRNTGLYHMEQLLGKSNAVTLKTPPSSFSLPSFYFQEYHCMAQDISLVSGVSCPRCVPPQFLGTPSLLTVTAVWKTKRASTLSQHCSTAAKTSAWYQCCFHHKSETQPHTRLGKELTLS